MSPEQVRGAPVDGGSDIFSLGAVLYEMLDGRRPFSRASAIDELHAILHDEPAPPRLPAGCPPALPPIITRCLAKAPSMRFASARDVGLALQAIPMPSRTAGGRTATAAPEILPGAVLDQRIAYCTTRDGVRIAYATSGQGPLLVRVLGWFTHLEMEWAWPDLRALWERLSETLTVVRYDGRGIGLSDRWTREFNEETRQLDLEAVLDAVSAGRPAALLGISEGAWTAASYAVRHPERISHLVMYGGYARGAAARSGYDPEEDRALLTLMRKGWGRESPAFRQVFTSQFYREDSDPELLAYFNELQRVSADPETAARYLASCHSRSDGTDLFAAVTTPTLVVHRRGDRGVAFEEGRYLASVVPGSRFLPLPGSAHYFPTRHDTAEPGTVDLTDAIARFVSGDPQGSSRTG
jgi:pimeloyl-ACP methyl ester carboxylesterase